MYTEVNFFPSFKDFEKAHFTNNNKYLIICTENTEFEFDNLKRVDYDFLGAVFPKIVYDNRLYMEGILVFTIDKNVELKFIKNLEKFKSDEIDFSQSKSIITIVDGFSNYNSLFLEKLYENLHLNSTLIGGGAGYFKNPNKNMIFNNRGVFNDAAILLILKKEMNLGISLGWEAFDGPFIATKCEGKILKEIDYINALDVYIDAIKKHYDVDINSENIHEILKKFPLGIVKHNNETLLRDVIEISESNELILAGDIEKNSIFNILKSQKKSLIKYIEKACEDAKIDESKSFFFFDCISRQDFLADKYESQINLICNRKNSKNIFGFLSIGEVANSENRYINFLNKSCVMGGICH